MYIEADELDRWQAAGLAYLDAVGAAVDELRPVRQCWRRWQPMRRLPVVGGWVSSTIEHAATALEAAERPGAQVFAGSSDSIPAVRGWQVTFRWPDSPVAVPSLRPPRPVCHCHRPSGWFYGVFGESRYLPEVVLAAATVHRFGREARDLPEYRLARKRRHGFTDYDRHLWRWELESPVEFAEELVDDRISWSCQCQGHVMITGRVAS